MENAVLTLAGIGIASLLCQWVSWWLRLPAILFLLLTGIILGPVLQWLDPNALFGDLLFPFVSLSVAVILFEGSLTLKFHEIRGLERVVRQMFSTGLLLTWLVSTLAAHYLVRFPWELAFLFGAVTVVTGPTVIVPMLRTVRPNARIANVLRWEGIVIDPVGALLAVLVFDFIISGSGAGGAIGHTLVVFGKIVLSGLILGGAGGLFIGNVLKRHWLPEYLHNMATLMVVFGVFALSNEMQEESGLLAVTVMGIWLANMKAVRVDQILDFKESLSLLLISGLFILLAARLRFDQFQLMGWAAGGVFLVMQFVARPLKIWVATLGSTLSWRERALLSWIAPRGIVAAAVSALFAIRLQQQGLPMADLLVPLTFMVIIGTVVLQSATAKPLAVLLKVAEPEPNGVLIIGANPVARAIAKALQQHKVSSVLADSNWDNIRAARMEGLTTFFGSAVSEHADRHLDLVGIGRLLGLSHHDDRNMLASYRYRTEFGLGALYHLAAKPEKSSHPKHKTARQGATLFGDDISYAKLASLIGQGAEIRNTRITENFSFNDYNKEYGKRAIPLFAMTAKGKLHLFSSEEKPEPLAGWTVVAFVSEAKQKPEAK